MAQRTFAKAKLANLFALVFFRDSTGEEDDDQAAVATGDGGYEVNFGKGPLKLDLDPGDDAKFLESNTPSTQFQEFTQLVVMVAMKALDLPYSLKYVSNRDFFETGFAYEVTARETLLARGFLAPCVPAPAECWGLFVWVGTNMKSNDLTDEQRRTNAFSAWAMVGIDVWQRLKKDGDRTQGQSAPAIKKNRSRKRVRDPPGSH